MTKHSGSSFRAHHMHALIPLSDPTTLILQLCVVLFLYQTIPKYYKYIFYKKN